MALKANLIGHPFESLTRGSNFWSKKVCEGGESVMEVDSLLIHLNFSSKLMITWLNLFETPLLICFQTDRKLTFDPVRTNKGGSKVKFRTIHEHVIDKLFEFSLLIHLHWFELDQKWVFDQFESGSKVDFRTNWVTWSFISKGNSGGSKVNRHTFALCDYLLHRLYWIKMWTPAYCSWAPPQQLKSTVVVLRMIQLRRRQWISR